MQIYIDADFKCYTALKEGRTALETDFFEGKCAAYIEGYRFVPAGKTWTAADGTVYSGEMITPWKPMVELGYHICICRCCDRSVRQEASGSGRRFRKRQSCRFHSCKRDRTCCRMGSCCTCT